MIRNVAWHVPLAESAFLAIQFILVKFAAGENKDYV